jgi:hypothetical protein
MLSEEAQVRREKEIEEEMEQQKIAAYTDVEKEDSLDNKCSPIFTYLNIFFTLMLLALFLTSTVPKIFASLTNKEKPNLIPVSNPKPINLPSKPTVTIKSTQIDDMVAITLKTGEVGTIKYLAHIIDSDPQTSGIYRIKVSNKIQDLAANSSLAELTAKPVLFREKLMKALSKKVEDIHIQPSLELLKPTRPTISIGDPLKF